MLNALENTIPYVWKSWQYVAIINGNQIPKNKLKNQ